MSYATMIMIQREEKLFRPLKTIQNKILRQITRAPWYITTEQIHNNLKIEPIYNNKCNTAKKKIRKNSRPPQPNY